MNKKLVDSDPKIKFIANYGAISFNPEMLNKIQILAAWEGMVMAQKNLSESEIETCKAIARALNDLSDTVFDDVADDEKSNIINALSDQYKTSLEVLTSQDI